MAPRNRKTGSAKLRRVPLRTAGVSVSNACVPRPTLPAVLCFAAVVLHCSSKQPKVGEARWHACLTRWFIQPVEGDLNTPYSTRSRRPEVPERTYGSI